jgi:Family of unknown function (DUF5681)
MTDISKDGNDADVVASEKLDPVAVESATKHKVGYASPPFHTRFQKGVSGNPRGRRSFLSAADDLLLNGANRMHKVRENGRVKKLSTEHVSYARVTLEAANGNFKAIKEVFKLIAGIERQIGSGNCKWNDGPDFLKSMDWKKEMEIMLSNHSPKNDHN